MGYRLEDLIRGSLRGGLIFGYVPANTGHKTPADYEGALRQEMERAKTAGLVTETCLSGELEELDHARTMAGITLCGLFADRLSPDELERILRCVKGDERAFFSRKYRTDPSKRRKKARETLEGQRGTLFELFPEVHQDFVLLLAHEPRIATLLRSSSHASSPLFDYRHHYRMIDLD